MIPCARDQVRSSQRYPTCPVVERVNPTSTPTNFKTKKGVDGRETPVVSLLLSTLYQDKPGLRFVVGRVDPF